MRCVQRAVDDHTPVKMDDATIGSAIPLQDGLSRRLVMLGHGEVVNGIKVGGVDGNTLVRICSIDGPDRRARNLLLGAYGAVAYGSVESRLALNWLSSLTGSRSSERHNCIVAGKLHVGGIQGLPIKRHDLSSSLSLVQGTILISRRRVFISIAKVLGTLRPYHDESSTGIHDWISERTERYHERQDRLWRMKSAGTSTS